MGILGVGVGGATAGYFEMYDFTPSESYDR